MNKLLWILRLAVFGGLAFLLYRRFVVVPVDNDAERHPMPRTSPSPASVADPAETARMVAEVRPDEAIDLTPEPTITTAGSAVSEE